MNGHRARGHKWAIVLAAGNGTRLSSLTRDAAGNAVPKQFCSLHGGASLLQQSLARAGAVVSRERLTAVVSPMHREYWVPALRGLQRNNIVVQPLNRGTGIGVLFPLLHIAARDPGARILILPSDHYVADEAVLEGALRIALEDIEYHSTGVTLLGMEAEEPDPDLGYIVSRASGHARLHQVQTFIEKPATSEALRLLGKGALWNSFILAARAQSLIELYARCCPDVLRALEAIDLRDYAQVAQLYSELPAIDFSRHIAIGNEQRLAVMAVPRCGWSDLGTPHRLARTLAQCPKQTAGERVATRVDGWINLADRLGQLHPAALSGERAAVSMSRGCGADSRSGAP